MAYMVDSDSPVKRSTCGLLKNFKMMILSRLLLRKIVVWGIDKRVENKHA